ncbi:MAG: FIST N-terminal domain-containing protein [Candidatus Binatia bacterium]
MTLVSQLFYIPTMIHAGVGQSAEPSTEKAVEQAFAGAFARAGVSRADWAVVFFTAEHLRDRERLSSALRRAAGTDRVVGCSAAGVLTGAAEVEGSHGLAALVVAADRLQADPFLFKPLRGRDAEVAGQIAKMAKPDPAKKLLTVLLPDTYNGQPQQLLQTVQSHIGYFPVVGAGSSESGIAGAIFQLCRDKIATNAVAGLHLSGPFQPLIDITQGCQPITAPLVITKADGNLIHEIDHRPAFEVFASVLKGPLLEDLRRALMYVFVGLPADRERNRVGPGEYLVRNIIGLDSSKGIIAVAEEVRQGQSMIFTLRDGQRARDDLAQMLRRQAQRLNGKKPAFGLYFNCCARGASLYGIPGIDSAYICQTLGDFPLIGMFGGYELAPLGGANHLFAYTGVLALISEEE